MRRKLWRMLAVVMGTTLLATGMSFADGIRPDGDTATVGDDVSLTGSPCTFPVKYNGSVELTRNNSNDLDPGSGSFNHFTQGESLTVSGVVSPTPSAGGMASTKTATSNPVLTSWSSNGTKFNIPIETTISSGTPNGSYTVTYTVTGISSGYYVSDSFNVTVSCTAATVSNAAPSVPGTPTLAAGSASPNVGVFGLTWTASTDDSGPISYRLEHKDSDDSAYSLVPNAGSLTTNSFSFSPPSPEAEGTWTYRVRASDGTATSAFSSDSSAVIVDRTAPNAPTLSVATGQTSFPVNGVTWYKDTVSVSIAHNGDPALADTSAGSGVDIASFVTPFSVTTNGTSTPTRTVKDHVANESLGGAITVNVDAQNPRVAITSGCPTADVILGSNQSVVVTASDGESGLATDPSGTVSLTTATVGEKIKQVTATDNVGHSASASCTYRVVFDWTGFFQPTDNPTFDTAGNPTTWNKAKAGSAIPVKFSLAGDQGLAIFVLGYPKTFAVTCPTVTGDAVEELSTGTTSGLKYDAVSDQYNYTWKTTSTYAGKCYRLDVKLIDQTTHSAYFQFTR